MRTVANRGYPLSQMANSATETRGNKRQRLIDGARELVYRDGVERPTLAEIAEEAEVPPGNVYYYFKTKDELIEAVIESRAAEVRELLEKLGRRRTPVARLKGLAHNWVEARDMVETQGCPLGTLSVELSDHGEGLDRQAAKLFTELIDWSEEQFKEIGVRDAREHALTLISSVQGAALLSNAFRDSEILVGQVRRLERWIDSLA
jgi:TetR/AcrR family transcriptional regulator, transcriptional repressor for nem operon